MDEQVLDVARSIRPYLPELVGDQAAQYDRHLVQLLAQARAGTDVDEAILELLRASPATDNWAALTLADEQHLPPQLQAPEGRSRGSYGGFSRLPNPHGGDAVDAEKYVCPVDGSYAWWRVSTGRPVPCCPDHPGVALVAARV